MKGNLSQVAFVFLVAAAVLLATFAIAHPGSGIVVDRLGQVFFLDTGAGLWKIDAKGALTHIGGDRFHWMAIDSDNRFAATRLPSGSRGDVLRKGSSPTLLIASDWPITMGRDGNLYYPLSESPEKLHILRLTPAGQSSVFAAIPLANGKDPFINGLTAAPDGTLYYTENKAIRKVTAQGKISTVLENIALTGCASIPGNEKDAGPYLRGLAVDARGTIFVAASGCGSVLKVTPNGKFTKVAQTQSPWSPTGIAISGTDVYALEFLHTLVEDRLLWLPRVRKISPDGKTAIVASVDKR